MRKPTLERVHPRDPAGTQRVYQFANGYVASVVRFRDRSAPAWSVFGGSFGNSYDLWELAVVRHLSDDPMDFTIDYDTGITSPSIDMGVHGSLDDAGVDALLAEIEALPPVEGK